MKTIINIPYKVYSKLQKHLLPKIQTYEEAAFVFADVFLNNGHLELNYKDLYFAQQGDYVSRSAFHFELTHKTNSRIIKQAHDLNTCIIEFHSHINQEYVRFSPTDWKGFSEFVPHVLWRLKEKPYVAVVLTTYGFDALVWMDNAQKPYGLYAIKTEKKYLFPTNNSLKHTKYE